MKPYEEAAKSEANQNDEKATAKSTPEPETSAPETETQPETEPQTEYVEQVWIPNSGSKYHRDSSCSNMKSPTQVSISEAERMGYTPCKRCY